MKVKLQSIVKIIRRIINLLEKSNNPKIIINKEEK